MPVLLAVQHAALPALDCAAAGVVATPCVQLPPPLFPMAAPAGLSALVSMLPSSEHVRSAYLGAEGILRVEPGQLHPHLLVDCSTIDPITSREVRALAVLLLFCR